MSVTLISFRTGFTDIKWHTRFVSDAVAQKNGLAFVNDNGNAIIRVDNSTTLSFGEKRESIRMTSKDRFKVGSVWIADFLHVPYGVRPSPTALLFSVLIRVLPFQCSTWPAFWSTTPDWPIGGEIDTFEGINDVKNNSMTLHTEPVSTAQCSKGADTHP